MVKHVAEGKQKRRMIRLTYQIEGGEPKTVDRLEDRWEQGLWEELQQANREIARASGSSIFFPTFRRIEGGFSITAKREYDVARFMGGRVVRYPSEIHFMSDQAGLQQAINQLSERISVREHRFVASISTDDIVRLLTSKYAEISEKSNRLHMELSKFILAEVEPDGRTGKVGTGSAKEANETLEEITQRAKTVVRDSGALLRPFTVLSELIADIFQDKGIKLADPVTLGEAREAIASDILSAGEKQMLSFLCYNAFANGACLFIDEPEISLHVDWQRMLFPVLLKQSTGNQFIVATHSPFIYSKYSDKELVLAQDRGDTNADAHHDRGRNYRLPEEDESADASGGRRE
jgi:predicted ATPase